MNASAGHPGPGGRVVLIVNEGRPRAVELAGVAAAWLTERGDEVLLPKRDAEASGLHHLAAEPAAVEAGARLVIALGGDGTVLRAVALAAPQGAPVLGVNVGRLGYLAIVEPDGLLTALTRVRAGDYGIEERSMLEVRIDDDGVQRHLAVNEAVLGKTQPGNTVHLALRIAGRHFTTYVADALIVATPTGSTAYSYSAGGPILSPHHSSLVVTPVASHTSFTHSLVLHADEPIDVEILDRNGAVLSIDGQEIRCLGRGATVGAGPAPVAARFVTFGDRDFFTVLKAKFGLADR